MGMRQKLGRLAIVLLLAAGMLLTLTVALADNDNRPREEKHRETQEPPRPITAAAELTRPVGLDSHIEAKPSDTGPDEPWRAEAEYIARTIWGEARGCSKTEQAAVVWCILNRVDSQDAYFPDDIVGVVTQPNQFAGYAPGNPVEPELYSLALDVLGRWQAEQAGVQNVGRVLPREYLFFTGDGRHNYFRASWPDGAAWDWSLPSPYEK